MNANTPACPNLPVPTLQLREGALWLEARLKAAVVIDPARHDLTEVAFGLCVTVADEDGVETTYEIVGEDEADATRRATAVVLGVAGHRAHERPLLALRAQRGVDGPQRAVGRRCRTRPRRARTNRPRPRPGRTAAVDRP